jgi:hypothetical protein
MDSDLQQYLEDIEFLRKEVPSLLEDIRKYALHSRLEGDHDAVERAQAMTDFVEEAFKDFLHPFDHNFSEN